MSSPESQAVAAPTQDAGQVVGFADLLEAFSDPSWRARKRAVDMLAREGSGEFTQQLLKILRSEHRNLSRLNAAIQVLTITQVDVVPEIEELLRAEEADVRGYAALTLGLRGDPRPIPALVAALADVESNVRVPAIEALGKLQAGDAVDELVKIVEAGDFSTAFPALDALGEIGDGRIAHHLLPQLADPFWQPAVIEALGKLGNEDVVPSLLEFLLNSPEFAGPIARSVCQIHRRYVELFGNGKAVREIVRNRGGSSLVSALRNGLVTASRNDLLALTTLLVWCPGSDVDAFLVEQLQSPPLDRLEIEQLSQRGAVVIPALLNLLKSGDEQSCIAALEALSRMRDERSYAPALALLQHPSAGVRQAAVALLNSLGHEALATDLPELLRDPEPLVRDAAVRVAAYSGIPSCFDLVFELANTGDAAVCRAALAHLPMLDDIRVTPSLIQALQDNDPRIRATAVNALAEVEDPQVVPWLQRALSDSDVWVRYHAARALRHADFERHSLEALTSCALHDAAMQVRISATEALGDYGSAAIPTLLIVAEDSESDLAQAAICSLGNTQSSSVIPWLTEKLRSSDQTVASAAVRALGQSRQPAAVQLLATIPHNRERECVPAAITALGQLQLAESRDVLLDLAAFPANRPLVAHCLVQHYSGDITGLAHRLPKLPLDVRRLLMEVLSRIRSPAAIDLLEASLNDSHPAVRFAALNAMSHLQAPLSPQQMVGERRI